MKKLLVLALLGLGLGGGVWKMQNPEGTVDDLHSQATVMAGRLTGGIQAGVQSIRAANPAAIAATSEEKQDLAGRLANLESSLSEQQSLAQRLDALEGSDTTTTSALLQQSLEQRLNALEESVAANPEAASLQQSLEQRLSALEESVAANPEAASLQQSLEQRLGALEESNTALAATAGTGSDGQQSAEINDQLSSVQARLDTADQARKTQLETINAAQTSLSELDGKIASVSDALTQYEVTVNNASAGNEAGIVRLDAIDSRLELLVRRLDEQTTDSEIQVLNENVDSITGQLSRLEESHASIRESVSSDLAALSERADTLNLRISTLASSSTQTQNISSGDSVAPDDASNNASESVALFNSGLDERFSAIESRLATVNSDSRRIAALTEQLDAARKKITQLEARDASTIQTVEDINSAIAELKTASESLSIDTVQAEIRDQLALVQSQFESNIADNNTDALEDLLNATRNQIQTLEKRVQELPASSSEADAAQQIQSALESQIAALERRLETADNTDPELVNSLSNVQQQVERLAAQGFVTQDDLRAQQEGKAVEYKIYFDRNSAEVTADAAKVLSSFITQEKNRTTGVSIFGFTDRRGSAIYNQQLALQRATNVRSYLIQNGLDYTKIKTLSGLGEDAAAAVLPDNSDDAQQRVVVLYAAQK